MTPIATYDLASGPPDVDASHTWTPSTGTAPPVLNDDPDSPQTFPWIRLEHIAGWADAPDADDVHEPNVGRPGATLRPGFEREKQLVYELEIQAQTRESLRATMTALRNGFRDRTRLGTMAVSPFSTIEGIDWTFQAQVLALTPDPRFDYHQGLAGPWRQGLTLTLRMVDARFYAGDEIAIPSVADGIVETVDNPGLAEIDPAIAVTLTTPGVATELLIVNSTLEQGILRFDLPDTVDGLDVEGLTVDFGTRTARVLLDGGGDADARPYLNVPATTWWDEFVPGLAPGDNDVVVDGGAWTMTFRPAVW